MSFSNEDVAEYYNVAHTQYELGWKLKESHSMHYGYWDETTRSFTEALHNTTVVMAEKGGIKASHRVLDAGCGVGGPAMQIHEMTKAKVTGITITERQVHIATKEAKRRGVSEEVDFHEMDFCATSFEDESFDVVITCESLCYTPDMPTFLKEMRRILKPGGRVVISTYFLTDNPLALNNPIIEKWKETWAMTTIVTDGSFTADAEELGFKIISFEDYTDQIMRSAKRMYRGGLFSYPLFELNNLLHPKMKRFSKINHRSGLYQYRGLKKNLWRHKLVVVEKK
ncbi:class I SAM-dependent methyltransferase [Phaeocystidibacter luteus]|uniref:Class I SAM-dependent methyltransferase n=1 Tax=Phaeocystidibacter luteus TaxID=911197 RepID=A0A6N6RID7_9FLAO|nr:class I SAM-dependent methyltransferase [Phaeocystidibacter luteus]KAB2810066.1 class I SAM-dependent methyltransferase [Phaeocystidibacter luteus]